MTAPPKRTSLDEGATVTANASDGTKSASSALDLEADAGSPLLHSDGLSTEEALAALKKHGYNEVVVKETPAYLQILSRYLGIVPLLMTLTAILSAAIFSVCTNDDFIDLCPCTNLNDWATFVLLLIELNLIVFADYTGTKSSGDAMKMLQEASASKVGVLRDGKWCSLPARELAPGDVVAITIGMTIPADGVICSEGEPVKLDYSSLTGEPLPEKKGKGDVVLSGAVVLVGESEMVVTRTGPESSLGTTQKLIAAAKAEKENGGEMASVLSKVVIAMTLVGIIFVIAIGATVGVRDGVPVGQCIKLAFVVLTAVLPATMPVVLTTTLAVGSRELAKDNAVVQRFSAIPEMAGMDILCSDKTGTLTLGEMTVIENECVVFHEDVTVAEMLELALVATRIEHSDAIDAALTRFFHDPKSVLSRYDVTKFIPFDPSTKKVTATATRVETGENIVVVKGAPPVLMNFEGVSDETFEKASKALTEKSLRGYKTLAVCVEQGEMKWKLLGFISLIDPPRSDTLHTVDRCNDLGVEVKMITGDQHLIAIEVARQLKLPNLTMYDRDVFGANSHVVDEVGGFENLCERAGGFAGVSPEHKHRVIAALQNRGHFVGMTGDGVNDAPALSAANVGVAVAGATDAAKGASDIVLQEEGLSTIVKAIYGSRIIFKRIENYLNYRISCSGTFGLVFLLLYVVSKFNFPTWTLILIKLLNDFAVASCGKDSVMTETTPQKLKIWKVTTVGVAVALASSLQVWGFVESILNTDPGKSHFWGLTSASPLGFSKCEVSSFTFLVLTITLQMNILVTRTPIPFIFVSKARDEYKHFVHVPPPSWQVLVSIGATLIIATFIACYWNLDIVLGSGSGMQGIGWRNTALTWTWAILWFVVTDGIKSLTTIMCDLFETGSAETYKNMYRNVFSLRWSRRRGRTQEKKELDDLRGRFNASLRDASIAQSPSLQFDTIVEESTLYHQDMLLSVDALRADPGLLRVISSMAGTINSLRERVDELEKKIV